VSGILSRSRSANGTTSFVFSVTANAALYAQLRVLEPASINVRNIDCHARLTNRSTGERFAKNASLAF
jgi:hypothetical protein